MAVFILVIWLPPLEVIAWIEIVFFDREILILFGASEELIPLAQRYIVPIKFVVPVFVFDQMFAAFLRNDNAPMRATIGVLAGSIFQHLLDGYQHACPKCVCSDLHDTYRRNPGDCTKHYSLVQYFLLVAAVKYFFNLLFPGFDETKGGLYCVYWTRCCNQRYLSVSAASGCWSKCNLVCAPRGLKNS